MRSAVAKRSVDVVIGLALTLAALPVILVLAVSNGVLLRTWPFFTQWRVGRNGRLFRIVKIRTLPPHVPPYASKTEIDHAAVPSICSAARRLHLDELPQLFLVLTGRLSLVGPRPEMPDQAEAMDSRFAEMRTSVRPGCTGLWQISPATDDPIAASPEYDLSYLRDGNLRMDAWVLWRTVLLLLGRGGPVGLGEIPRWAAPAPAGSEPLVALADSTP